MQNAVNLLKNVGYKKDENEGRIGTLSSSIHASNKKIKTIFLLAKCD
jgi:hypothetical protein